MSLQKLKQRALTNPEVRVEYEKLDSAFDLIDKLLSMRTKAGLTQEQLAERMQTQKSEIL
ncbi:hypothetical protein [Paenalcaligenes faecalis]|uniref:hypothetical protein n=1 Tax=Paenalcaligenes faecalis TaxID=2980099 RepID=UPI0022B94E9D|nr:hypothetical protein [Paenalcaligenes faecalis]